MGYRGHQALGESLLHFAKRDNTIFFSTAGCWEIAIKAKLGKLQLPGENMDFIGDQLRINRISPLAVTMGHAMQVYKLLDHHRDPFDRILVAQMGQGDRFLVPLALISQNSAEVIIMPRLAERSSSVICHIILLFMVHILIRTGNPKASSTGASFVARDKGPVPLSLMRSF